MSSQRTIKLLATAFLEGAQGILETQKAPSPACFGARRVKEGFWEETRYRVRKWYLWLRAAGVEEKGAQEVGLSSYCLPGPARQ